MRIAFKKGRSVTADPFAGIHVTPEGADLQGLWRRGDDQSPSGSSGTSSPRVMGGPVEGDRLTGRSARAAVADRLLTSGVWKSPVRGYVRAHAGCGVGGHEGVRLMTEPTTEAEAPNVPSVGLGVRALVAIGGLHYRAGRMGALLYKYLGLEETGRARLSFLDDE